MRMRTQFWLFWGIVLSSLAGAQEKPPMPPTPEVQKLLDEGNASIKKSDWTTALKICEQARDMAQKTKDAAGEANALDNSGLIYSRLGQYPKALEFYQQALSLYRQIGNASGEAMMINNIGDVYRRFGKMPEAIENFQHASTLFKKAGNRRGEAITLNNIGNVYLLSSQPPKALEYFQQALPLFRQGKNRSEEAIVLTNIGKVYRNEQPQKALEWYHQALPLFQQIGNRYGEANALTEIGNIYTTTGQQAKALEFYQQALPLYRKIQSISGEAGALAQIGNVYAALNQHKKAASYYLQALPLIKKTGEILSEATVLGNLGLTYEHTGQKDKALQCYQDALPLFKQTGNTGGEAGTLNDIGLIYKKRGQWQKALEYFQQTLPLFRQDNQKHGEAAALTNLGSVSIALGKYAQAEKFLQDCMILTEQMRNAIGGSAENRQEYLASVLDNYAMLLLVQVQLKENARAFATLNKMKARSLLDQGQRTRRLRAALSAEEQASLRKRWQRVDSLSLAVVASERRGKPAQQAARDRLRSAEQLLQTEQDTLFARHPEAAEQEAFTITLAEVPKFLSADTALLEYGTLDLKLNEKQPDVSWLFVVTCEQGKAVLTVHRLPFVLSQAAFDQFRQICAKPGHPYKPLARKLASSVLPIDVQKRITGKKRLLVCPDGAVWSVPFAALILPDGKHLIEKYEIDYAYSATGAQAALSVPHSKATGTLVLANPDFGDTSRFGNSLPNQIAKGIERPLSDPARPLSDPARLASIMDRGKIKPLPGTKIEANAIAKLYPNATLMTGKDAQETELVKALPKYRYLHFATHGLFSDTAPLQSAIVLAAPPKGSEDDGFLTAREIAEMNLNAEMAVLSACETARGKNTEGEGVVGLTWALFAAGVPTQVVSQWKVSDASTPQLMTAFYSNLKKGESKGKALRNAALSMLHDGKHAHPYHWAAFVLFGDWR